MTVGRTSLALSLTRSTPDLLADATLRLHKRALAPVSRTSPSPSVRTRVKHPEADFCFRFLLARVQTMSNSFLAIASVHFSQHMDNLIALWQAKLKLAMESDGAKELFWDAEQDLHSLTTVRLSTSSSSRSRKD